jgi:hypothetical protein
MSEDPIVDEIHEIRRKLLEEYGGIDGYLRHIKELEVELGDRVVRRPPRRPITVNQKAS